jgi:hypothetical protein
LSTFLPSNLDQLAKETGAVSRWRKVKNGEDLLRLILMYVVEDLSLRSTAAWSGRSELVEIKDTSVLHRLRSSVPFLEAVLGHLLNFRLRGEPAAGPVLRLNDATVLSVPGSEGTDWRVHAVYDPEAGRLVRVQVTDFRGGERLDRDVYAPGEVVIADRGLARAKGLHAVAGGGAFSLLRMHWQNIRLTDRHSRELDLEEILRRAERGDTGTIIYVPLKGKEPLPARLIVRPLPPEPAEKARHQIRRNAAKKGRQPSPLALRLAGYFCLLTTLPAGLASDGVVLELYRVRWQIELFFKRCKSLLHLNQLRADDPALVKAYCTGKLIEVVLIELLASEGEAFSPWGVPRRRVAAA